MGIHLRTLETRVARRVFLLFLLCAALPVVTFAGIGYVQVRGQLTDQTWERLASASESTATSLMERLLLLEADLAHPATERRGSPLTADEGGLWVERGQFPLPASESSPPLSGLDTRQLVAIRNGRAIVRPGAGSGGVRVFSGRPEAAIVRWGRINPSFLRGVAQALPDGASLCVWADEAAIVPCGLSIPGSPSSRAARSSSHRSSWQAHDGPRLSVERELFLAGEFASPSWRVAVSEPRALGLAPIRSFTRAFVLVMLLCTLLVALASDLQLKRILGPLARLRAGTERVAQGDLGGWVDVNTGDEFEELAGSFNHMVGRIRDLLGELDELNVGTIRALASAIDAKSRWTAGHSDRVTKVSVEIGRAMGLSGADLEALERGAILHDVGKIAVPLHVLDKDGPLDEGDWALMRAHPGHGVRIVRPITRYARLLPIIGQHHERVDGSGYPDGLKGEEIDIMARIVAIADAFDAMTSDRPYRAGMRVERALAIIREESGTMFDSEIASVFLRLRQWDREPEDRPTKAPPDLRRMA